MKEFVSFFLSGKLYGADIEHMQGIEKYREFAPVAGVELPECLHGLIDVRGELIPFVDIRKHLVLPATGITDDTKHIIFRTRYGRLACQIDGVSQILKADENHIRGVPELTQTSDIGYLDCIVKSGRDLILIVNPDSLLNAKEWVLVKKMFQQIDEQKKKEEEERRKREEERKKSEAALKEAQNKEE